MTTTRIELSFNRIARIADAADLAELLFPGNRNHQHCFLAIWFALTWAPHGMVPNLTEVATRHGITRRTFERVRAKLRRIGLIDHVSRFDKTFGYREGWILSHRFERSLRVMADRVAELGQPAPDAREKDAMMLRYAAALRGTGSASRNANQEVIYHHAEQ